MNEERITKIITRAIDTYGCEAQLKMAIEEMNRKDMITCIAYCMKAIISPTCSFPRSIPRAPEYTVSTVTRFMIKAMNGPIKAMSRLTKRLVL